MHDQAMQWKPTEPSTVWRTRQGIGLVSGRLLIWSREAGNHFGNQIRMRQHQILVTRNALGSPAQIPRGRRASFLRADRSSIFLRRTAAAALARKPTKICGAALCRTLRQIPSLPYGSTSESPSLHITWLWINANVLVLIITGRR